MLSRLPARLSLLVILPLFLLGCDSAGPNSAFKLTSSEPKDGQKGVSITNVDFTLTFSEPVDSMSVKNQIEIFQKDRKLPFRYFTNGNKVLIKLFPEENLDEAQKDLQILLYDAFYKTSVSQKIKSINGQALGKSHKINFKTHGKPE